MIKRITISVPEAVAQRIRREAGAKAVSAWVTEVVEEHLSDVDLERKRQAFYRDVNPSQKDIKQAAALFDRLTKPRRGWRVA